MRAIGLLYIWCPLGAYSVPVCDRNDEGHRPALYLVPVGRLFTGRRRTSCARPPAPLAASLFARSSPPTIHAVGALSSARLARPTFSMIFSAVLDQTKGLGSSLCPSM